VLFRSQSRARRRAEKRLLDLADSLPGALYRLRTHRDGRRTFEFLSSGVERLRAVRRDAAMRDFSAMWETIVEEDRAAVAASMAHAERELAPVEYEFRVKRPGGEPCWLRASATLRREADGSVLWNGYWSDVTEEKKLQGELQAARNAAEDASRAKSTFLATMSHEIRTPMNGVLGMLELLALSKLDPEQRTTLGIIRESGRSLLRIIDDILDFSKIEAGKLDVRPEPGSVADVIERVCDIYSGNASSKGLLLKRFVDGRIRSAHRLDALRVQQILNNFVSNAIKFTERGEVEVRADLVRGDADNQVVALSVHDTGIGIAEADKERLFMPFVQASGGMSPRQGGTGLGLSICRRLAQMMDGTIDMQSAQGRGTTMTLTLPLPVVEAPAASPSREGQPVAPLLTQDRVPPSIDEARTQKRLVLLVDDHPINRIVLLKQVNRLGYAAEVAQNGVEAIDLWGRGGIGVVLTDCNMPEMNGYDLARHIRACEARNGHARVPIVACTANALSGEAENCFAAGMDDYLAKPIDLHKLAQKLAQWLPGAQPQARGHDEALVIDAAAIAEFAGGDPGLERQLLERFVHYNAEDMAALEHSLAQRDATQAMHASHRMKGAGRTIGAARFAAACERMEHAAKDEDWPAIDAALDPLKTELARLEAHIAGKPFPTVAAVRAAPSTP